MKLFVMFLIKIRWVYFHINPNYIKFYISDSEAHFQNRKTGLLHSDFIWDDKGGEL